MICIFIYICVLILKPTFFKIKSENMCITILTKKCTLCLSYSLSRIARDDFKSTYYYLDSEVTEISEVYFNIKLLLDLLDWANCPVTARRVKRVINLYCKFPKRKTHTSITAALCTPVYLCVH